MSRVQSVERAIALLRAVAAQPRGLVELAAAADLPTSTAARLLSTLEETDTVARDADGRYRVGPLIVAIAPPRDRAEAGGIPRLSDVAAPVMRDLAGRLDEAVGLVVPAGDDVAVIAHLDAPKPIRMEDWTGTRWPLHAGCSGIVLMSTWSEDSVAARLRGPLAALTDATPTDPADLRRRIDAARRAGFSWSRGHYVDGLTSVAAPITDDAGRGVAALYVSGPSYRFPAEAGRGVVERLLRGAAAEVSASLLGADPELSAGRRAS